MRAARSGADDGHRTRDIDLGRVALYQLSYIRKAPDPCPTGPLGVMWHGIRALPPCGRPAIGVVEKAVSVWRRVLYAQRMPPQFIGILKPDHARQSRSDLTKLDAHGGVIEMPGEADQRAIHRH